MLDKEKTIPPYFQTEYSIPFCFESGYKILKRYRVLAVLGQGSMGIVYKCQDEDTGIDVAIKALFPNISHDYKIMTFIKSNFQTIEKLHHPYIADLKSLAKDCSNGLYYFVMEYVHGQTLKEWLKDGVSKEAIFRILQQIAEALDFVHKEKVIHRDIKPDNIMITSSGDIKILDFGIATRLKNTPYEQNDKDFCGTIHYIAPELWDSKNNVGASQATDQYSLAIVAYECLFKERPFEAHSRNELYSKISSLDINFPPTALFQERRAFKKALAQSPENRYSSCSEFIQDLSKNPFYTSSKAWISLCLVIIFGVIVYWLATDVTDDKKIPASIPNTPTVSRSLSPRLLIRTQEKIRNIDAEKGLTQGLLQELALKYGFLTINPDFTKDKYDFIIDVKFTGAYRQETMSFNSKIKLHAFSLGADINATYPNGNLISQVTLRSKDYRIGKIGDAQEALRESMHRRLAAEDETSFRTLLLQILECWCREQKEGKSIDICFVNDALDDVDLQKELLMFLKQRNLLVDCVHRSQDKNTGSLWEVRSKLQSTDLSRLVVVLSNEKLKIINVNHSQITLEKE